MVVVPAGAGGVEEAAGSLEDAVRWLDAADGDDQPGAGVLGEGEALQHQEVGLVLLHRALVVEARGAAGAGGAAVGAIRPEGCWSAVAMP